MIRSSNWLGDAVMSVPAVRAIKRGRPDARVAVLTSENLSPMWRLVDEVDEVITANTSSVFSAVRAIKRAGRFDVAVLFPNSLRTAIEVWVGGVQRRVGYRGHHRSWLLNQVVKERGKPRPLEHQSRRYLRIAHELGADVSEIDPGQAVRPANGAPVIRQVTAGRSKRLGLCPGAEYGPAKRWLPERFAETATAIADRYSVQWVLFGREGDSTVGAQIASALGDRCVDRIGKTTVQELIDELRTCRLLLTNDTGTMHLAALLGVPTVAVFGSTEPQLTAPLGRDHRVIRHHVECSPCFLRKCPIDFRCMKAVTAAEVVDAISTFLDTEASL